MSVAALKLAGVVNKSGRGRKIFRARFARRLFSTLLDEILDTPLIKVYNVKYSYGDKSSDTAFLPEHVIISYLLWMTHMISR